MKSYKLSVLIFFLFFTISFTITGLFLTHTQSDSLSPLSKTQPITPTPTPTPDPLRPKNVLIMGYGGGNHDGGSLTDTIIAAHIRPRDQKVFLISIPRDLWISLPVNKEATESHKINAAYAIGLDHRKYPNKREDFMGKDGGRLLASYAVKQVTGLTIDHAVSISFSGFLKAITLLEPLVVEVPQSFIDPYYPIEGKENDSCDKTEEDIKNITATMSGFLLEKEFTCRYETISYTKGNQTMTAQEALKFVRSRHSGIDGGDFNRSRRQAALLNAIKKKLSSPSIIPKLIPLATTVLSSIDTDISISALPELIQLYSNFQSFEISTINLTTENVFIERIGPQNQYILTPIDGNSNYTPVHQFIESEILTRIASSSGAIQ